MRTPWDAAVSRPRSPARLLGPLAVLAMLVTGCATSDAASDPATSTADSGHMSMAPGMSMTDMDRRPSAAARMVCGTEIRHDIAEILELSEAPSGDSTWEHGRFSCMFQLATGPLVLSVEDSRSAAAGRTYFAAVMAQAIDPEPLHGLESFGLPSFRTAAGTVAFLKDGKTLTVDATGQAQSIGPDRLSPNELAYAVAADVIGCWSE